MCWVRRTSLLVRLALIAAVLKLFGSVRELSGTAAVLDSMEVIYVFCLAWIRVSISFFLFFLYFCLYFFRVFTV